MAFNLLLALIPLLIAVMIFRKSLWTNHANLKPLFYFFTFVFFLFLPNAPYTLTDIIHLIRQIKEYRYFGLNDDVITTLLIPQYAIFLFLGLSFYTLSINYFFYFLRTMHISSRLIKIFYFVIPFFMSIGVFLGRVHRFSSWDIIIHLPTMLRTMAAELKNISFYMYIIYFYCILLVLNMLCTIFYRSIFKKIF